MIEFKQGNLLEEQVEAIVNTVNCVGVMGKGIALQFKQAFPENFREYQKACRAGVVQPGSMFTVSTGSLLFPRYIINFPTKRHWKGKSKLEDIKSGLKALVTELKKLGISSIAIPPLGCGNGGLDWAKVKPLIESAFSEISEIKVVIFEPIGAPEVDKMQVERSQTPTVQTSTYSQSLAAPSSTKLVKIELISTLPSQKLTFCRVFDLKLV